MPRHSTHQNLEKRSGGNCKIRKRVSSSSSSSSSSAAKNYRFKRAWKQVIMASSRSPMQKLQSFENGVKCSKDGGGSSGGHHYKGKEGLSARKLAATLWEINGLHSPGSAGFKEDNFEYRKERDRGRKTSEQHFLLDQQPHSPRFEVKFSFF